MSTAGPWHYEGHYILTDSEPQEVIAERVSEANRGLIASAPQLQAKIEALADALTAYTKAHDAAAHAEEIAPEYPTAECDCDLCFAADAALKAAGRIP